MSRYNANGISRADIALSQWTEQRPDLDARVMTIFGRLIESSESVHKLHLMPLYKEFDLQRGEFDVLATLRRSGPPYALAPGELQQSMMISSGGLTNRVDRLVKASLVERHRSAEDRRGVIVKLTQAGLEKIDEMLTIHVSRQSKMLSDLTSDDCMQLDQLLSKLVNSIDRSLSRAE